jgi:spore germination cell wall hydrolase CwlJ-like protein
MSNDLVAARSALKLGFFVSSLTIASLGARLATANISPDGDAHAFGLQTANAAHGDLSDKSLKTAFGAQGDPLFARHDPGAKPPTTADLLRQYEQGAPVFHTEVSAEAAQTVNAGLPVSAAPNPAARPFVFRGSAADRQAAVTCLTQAVYYEAGFEPIEGARAVAQVVLNRVRHPIFPKSVCGVVYQGAELKTGCQFSFTCDGALGRAPARGAGDRANKVAEQALSGFVMKDVGEATHYHTDWMLPWWAPTVSKVAKVGTQIFYRWPGQLGMPGAFVGRYMGGEHVGRGALTAPGGAMVASTIGAEGRVHAVLQAASAAMPSSAGSAVLSKADAMQAMEMASAKPSTPDAKSSLSATAGQP